jgi:hypothetical protein
VQGFEAVARNMAALGGTSRQSDAGAAQGMRTMEITLYDSSSQ